MSRDDLEIPAFLRLTAEQRAEGWAGHEPRPAPTFDTKIDSDAVRLIREAQEEERLAKSRARVAKMLAKKEDHTGMTWNSRIARWVPINQRYNNRSALMSNTDGVTTGPATQKQPAAVAPAPGTAPAKSEGAKAPAKKAAAKAPAKKPAAAKKAAAPAKKAAAPDSNRFAGTEVIKLKTKENPHRAGTRLQKTFALVKDGMTVEQFADQLKSRLQIARGTAFTIIRYFEEHDEVSIK